MPNCPSRVLSSSLWRLSSFFRRQKANTTSRNLTIPIHPQIVSNPLTRQQLRSIAFLQTRNMEEDILPPGIRPQKSKALLAEVSHDRTSLRIRRTLLRILTTGRARRSVRTSRLIAHSLLQQRHILIREFARRPA